jgi:hypothetical protein
VPPRPAWAQRPFFCPCFTVLCRCCRLPFGVCAGGLWEPCFIWLVPCVVVPLLSSGWFVLLCCFCCLRYVAGSALFPACASRYPASLTTPSFVSLLRLIVTYHNVWLWYSGMQHSRTKVYAFKERRKHAAPTWPPSSRTESSQRLLDTFSDSVFVPRLHRCEEILC